MNYKRKFHRLRGTRVYLNDYQTEEILKCRNNIVYFVENYGVVLHPKLGLTKIKLYPKQKEALINFTKYPFNIILKSRQIGMSTTIALFGAWALVFIPNFYLGVVSRNREEAVELAKKIKRAITNLPAFMWGGKFLVNNKKNFQLLNGSRCITSAPSGDAFRGETLNYVIIDEVVAMRYIKELFASVYFTISQNFVNIEDLYSKKMRNKPTGIALISTAGNLKHFWVKWFYKRWVNALKQNNDYVYGSIKWKALSIHWSEVPFCDEEWYENIRSNYGEDLELFEQEVELKFTGEEYLKQEDEIYVAKDLFVKADEIFNTPEVNWADIKNNYV